MSRRLTDGDVAAIRGLMSAERLGTFKRIADADLDAIELHQAAMGLSGALTAVIGVIEVSLRNAICRRISADLGVQDCLRSPPSNFSWAEPEQRNIVKAEAMARRAAYAKLNNGQKLALDALAFPQGVPANIKRSRLAIRRQGEIPVSEGQVVAQLTIYFWKRLFSENYEKTLWKRSLKKVFPNKTYSRARIADNLEVIYQTRNRLAHHEPVFGKRLREAMDAIEFISRNLGSRRPTDETPLAKLMMPHLKSLSAATTEFQKIIEKTKEARESEGKTEMKAAQAAVVGE
ncbi:hypothetical protein [Chelativorans sp. YIM 93263]|uniref:hypothetical protein n=1 Tax=Chelativorans sp. YIM 93263 TaxID=2906648 RepID=UPI002378C353|nr:hypothetical protein [Chelativorans sp. YIM 93263]